MRKNPIRFPRGCICEVALIACGGEFMVGPVASFVLQVV